MIILIMLQKATENFANRLKKPKKKKKVKEKIELPTSSPFDHVSNLTSFFGHLSFHESFNVWFLFGTDSHYWHEFLLFHKSDDFKMVLSVAHKDRGKGRNQFTFGVVTHHPPPPHPRPQVN